MFFIHLLNPPKLKIQDVVNSNLKVVRPTFLSQMATRRKQRNLPAVIGESQEQHHRKNLSRDTNVPRVKEDYITQFYEKIFAEGVKNDSGFYQDKEVSSGRCVQTGRVSFELTNSGAIQYHSGDFIELWQGKPGTHRWPFPEWSSSWNEHFCLQKFRPWRGKPQSVPELPNLPFSKQTCIARLNFEEKPRDRVN